MKLSKKGFQLTEVPALVIVFVVVAVVMGIGATILSQVQTTQTSGTLPYNITNQGLAAVSTLSGWQSTWAIIVAAAVVLGILGLLMYFKGNQ